MVQASCTTVKVPRPVSAGDGRRPSYTSLTEPIQIVTESVTFATMVCNDIMLLIRPTNCWVEELLGKSRFVRRPRPDRAAFSDAVVPDDAAADRTVRQAVTGVASDFGSALVRLQLLDLASYLARNAALYLARNHGPVPGPSLDPLRGRLDQHRLLFRARRLPRPGRVPSLVADHDHGHDRAPASRPRCVLRRGRAQAALRPDPGLRVRRHRIATDRPARLHRLRVHGLRASTERDPDLVPGLEVVQQAVRGEAEARSCRATARLHSGHGVRVPASAAGPGRVPGAEAVHDAGAVGREPDVLGAAAQPGA